MTTHSHKEDVKGYSESLLSLENGDSQVKETIDKIHNCFQDIVGISGLEDNMQRMAAIDTKFGKALGLNHAAQCLIDYKRTHQFLKGITTAISKKQEEYPNQKIKIFYAGCGPYAPFITLVAPLYKPDEVEFTLLDINGESMNFAKKLINELGLSDYVDTYHVEDAVKFQVPSADQYHILFSETLDAMLFRECYVPILCNLLPQFKENVILIPENVQIKMSFVTYGENDERNEDPPQVVFDSRKAVLAAEKLGGIPNQFEPVKVPMIRNRNIEAFAIDTEVLVHDDLKMVRYESDLTRPIEMGINAPDQTNSVVFTYRIQPVIELYTSLE